MKQVDAIQELYLNILELNNLSEGKIEKILNIKDLPKAKKIYNKGIKSIEDYIKKQGVNLARFQKDSKAIAKYAIPAIKKREDPKRLAITVSGMMGDVIKDATRDVIGHGGEKIEDKEGDSKSIVNSIAMFCFILGLNTILFHVSILFLGPLAGSVLGIVILGPIVEETTKRYAVLKGFGITFGTMFGVNEFLWYILQALLRGTFTPQLLVTRAAVILAHVILAIIQKEHHQKSVDRQDPKYSYIGYFVALFLHMLNNGAAVLAVI